MYARTASVVLHKFLSRRLYAIVLFVVWMVVSSNTTLQPNHPNRGTNVVGGLLLRLHCNFGKNEIEGDIADAAHLKVVSLGKFTSFRVLPLHF